PSPRPHRKGQRSLTECLQSNGSREAIFDVSLLTVFKVDVEDANVTDQQNGVNADTGSAQVSAQVSTQVKTLIINLEEGYMGLTEMIKLTKFSPSSRNYFRKTILKPAIELGLIELEKKETPKTPKQRYRLTQLGKEVKAQLQKEKERK
ncbi:MAG: hypothetical protein LIP03_07850, partial [Bacteroidales bacterium]|nr:hypothetical protein [Bacteroidales bacterium]